LQNKWKIITTFAKQVQVEENYNTIMDKGGHSLHFNNKMNFFENNQVATESADVQADLEAGKNANLRRTNPAASVMAPKQHLPISKTLKKKEEQSPKKSTFRGENRQISYEETKVT
jgi:hypothetical protein